MKPDPSFKKDLATKLVECTIGDKSICNYLGSLQASLDCCATTSFIPVPKKPNDQITLKETNNIIELMVECCKKYDEKKNKCEEYRKKCDEKYEDHVDNYKVIIIIICIFAIIFDALLSFSFYKYGY